MMIHLMIVAAILHSILLDIPVPTFEPIPSPTPIPTYSRGAMATPVLLTGNVFNILSTVEYGLRTLPDDIRNPGLPVVPGPDGSTLFGYAKWLVSPFAAREIFGPFADFAPRVQNKIAIDVAILAVSAVLFFAVVALRFIVWVLTHVRMLLPI